MRIRDLSLVSERRGDAVAVYLYAMVCGFSEMEKSRVVNLDCLGSLLSYLVLVAHFGQLTLVTSKQDNPGSLG